ncbi:MAG TPA: PepSY-associated TM helix domain-containing protein [Rhizomicrobium sp.]|nr:PepSY-associated TM helix domain-containing protein [Rhizomicrobium sp.]
MRFTQLRRLLFQLHMWIGLLLGLFLAALGLSGSAIVYDQEIAAFLNPPPAVVAHGDLLSLDTLAQAARKAMGSQGQVQITLPVTAETPVVARVSAPPRDNAVRDGTRGPGQGSQLYLDPVSGAVLDRRSSPLPAILAFAHQLHGNFLMGRDGRTQVVGWLGVAMCILGLSGLVLWWPRRGQWKYAFGVRRTAKGLRFHRELHAAVGIWVFAVFMAVSFSGVVLAWPQLFGMPGPGQQAGGTPPAVAASGQRVSADAALKLALDAVPGAIPRSISLPARAGQPVSVALFSHGAVAATVLVDPYKAQVISVRDPFANWAAWQRPVHQGLLGPVWRFLLFLSGLVPALFVTTGVVMWWKKYRVHIPMTVPLAEEAAS